MAHEARLIQKCHLISWKIMFVMTKNFMVALINRWIFERHSNRWSIIAVYDKYSETRGCCNH